MSKSKQLQKSDENPIVTDLVTTIALLIGVPRLEKLDKEIEKRNAEITEEYLKNSPRPMTENQLKLYTKELQRKVNNHDITLKEANRLIREAKNPTMPERPKKISRRTVIEELIDNHL